MRSLTSVAAIGLAAALLAGCAGQQTRSGGQGPDNQTLAKLQVGKSTTAEVKDLLGPPIRTTRFDRLQREVWEYRRYEDPFNEYEVSVQFSPDGIVREVLVLRNLNRDVCGPA
jgi:outer membrane protein assembly factor BamE (lipoprotein component of BamABCDE complex)